MYVITLSAVQLANRQEYLEFCQMPMKTDVVNGNEDHYLCPLCYLFFVERVPNLAYSQKGAKGNRDANFFVLVIRRF